MTRWDRCAFAAALAAAVLTTAAPAAAAAGSADYPEILERYGRSVVPVRYTLRPREAPPGGEGQKVEEVICGVVTGDDGLIVISGDPFPDPGGDPRTTLDPVDFAVVDAGETEYPADPVGLNRDLNLAYLRLRDGLPSGYRPVRFDADVSIRIGDEVVILGLLPERYGFARTFWSGQVSAAITTPRPMYAVTAFVQDLSIGGLAVRPDGQPLGLIAEDVLPPGTSTRDMPANALSILGSLAQGPRVGYPMIFPFPVFRDDLASPPPLEQEPARSWFGITMQPLSRSLGDYWGIQNPGGVIVTSVLDGSPAEAARIRTGDIILDVGGTTVTARETADLAIFRQMVEKLPQGEAVPVRVWRDGGRVDLSIRPGTAPRTGFLAREYRDEDFGLTVREITLDVIQGQNLRPDIQGVVVSELERSGWSMVAGLGVGDIILRVDEVPVEGLDSFRNLLQAAREGRLREIYFFVLRGVETLFVTVRTDW